MLIGAADYHGYGSTCFVWTAINIPGWHQMGYDQKTESILDVFRRKGISKIKVLLYNDRKVFDREQIFLSPVFTIMSYFRTMDFWQVLSWLIWLFLLRYIILQLFYSNKFEHLNLRSRPVLGGLALISSLYMLILGFRLINKSQHFSDYNDIYLEYGTIMLWSGAGFLIYLMVLIIFEIGRMRIKNK
jgi:hypothetical protein